MGGGRVGGSFGGVCDDTDIGATLVALVAGQDPVAKILFCSLVGGKDLYDGPGKADHLAVFVEGC